LAIARVAARPSAPVGPVSNTVPVVIAFMFLRSSSTGPIAGDGNRQLST
jgi:hypothetical protein